MAKYDYLIKIMFFGKPSEGKQDLTKYCDQSFSSKYSKSTTGVELYPIDIQSKGKLVKLQLWDISEKERFRSFIPNFMKGANGALLIYDIANSKTLDSLVKYIPIVRENAGNIPIILIGTKSDIEVNREVSKEYGNKIARKYNLSAFVEISSKKEDDVKQMFEAFTELFIVFYEKDLKNKVHQD